MAVPRDPGPGGTGGYGGGGLGLTIGGWLAIAVASVLLVERWPTFVYGVLLLSLLYLAMSRADELTDRGQRLLAGAGAITS